MKDRHPSNVNGQDVAATDDTVMTSGVASSGVAPAASLIAPVVEAAFDAHAPALKAFALAAVRDDEAADDLVQETFLRFIHHVRQDGLPDNAAAWLHRVCANLIVSRGRRDQVAQRKRSLLADPAIGMSPEDHVVRQDEDAQLRDALGELPADARAALLMAAAGFSSAEIAESIGRSAGATSTYICRARVRLRQLLSPARDPDR